LVTWTLPLFTFTPTCPRVEVLISATLWPLGTFTLTCLWIQNLVLWAPSVFALTPTCPRVEVLISATLIGYIVACWHTRIDMFVDSKPGSVGTVCFARVDSLVWRAGDV
jgi:hypothetical protein